MKLRVAFFLCLVISMVSEVFGASDRWRPNCKDPISHGGGNKYIVRYAYNATARECNTFFWGGQNRNGNNFDNLYDCIITCYQETKKPKKLPNIFP
ncbi:Kunitz/Bovine pancreatic trypsin inhibitor domain protein [Ancylostoma caninum]|uniref:Kunitz/Bovine pancreatic trypsin inhibitor domain protein n=1 Tax=Ancylostoma caninum TaxID=29170 RepID=A0A368HA59_ANCCA|nr:Kunitz/Bovine pancreatic trypsin inhibitor domain protein [Ancylostoma caninum]